MMGFYRLFAYYAYSHIHVKLDIWMTKSNPSYNKTLLTSYYATLVFEAW